MKCFMPVVRVISLRLHAASDALVTIAAFLVPWVFGFAGLDLPSLVVWGITAVALLLNLTSQYPLGVVRLIPMKVHSLLEYAAAPLFFIMPIAFFSDVPGVPIAIPVLGAVNLLTNALTDYPAGPQSAASPALTAGTGLPARRAATTGTDRQA